MLPYCPEQVPMLCYYIVLASFPGPRPASCRLQYGKAYCKQREAGQGPGNEASIVSNKYPCCVTVLSRTRAHGHSQFKHQKLRVSGYTKEVFEWSNYLHASTHSGCEVSCQGVPNRPASSVHPCFVEASLMVENTVSC